MKVIYKYQLEITEHQEIAIPHKAKILSAEFQGSRLYVWALVETDNDIKHRLFYIAGTGQNLGNIDLDECIHIATVGQHGDVWHIFLKI